MRLLPLLLLVTVTLAAQIQADFYRQDGVQIGQFYQYAVKVTNASDVAATVPGVLVWNQARERGGFTPQLTSTVLAAQKTGSGTTVKARLLQVAAVVAATGTALTGTKVLGNLDPDKGWGKAITIAGPTITTIAAFGSAIIPKIPDAEAVDPQVDKILPGLIQLPAHGSADYILWGVPITQ